MMGRPSDHQIIEETCSCGATFRYDGPMSSAHYRHTEWLTMHHHTPPPKENS